MLDKYILLSMQSPEYEDVVIIISIIDTECRLHTVLCFTTLTAPANDTHKTSNL